MSKQPMFSDMTLRDYFAAQALPAAYKDYLEYLVDSPAPPDWRVVVALDAYQMADAMIEVRSKNNEA